MAKQFHVYILASKRNGTIYIGMTGNLIARIAAHREGKGSTFVKRYAVDMLVHVENYPTALEAIMREKALKKWRRSWKLRLIEENNPAWHDLFGDLNA